MSASMTWGRIVAGIAGVYHLCVGAILIVSGETAIRLAKTLAGWTVEGSPALDVVGELLGCYIVAFGLMMLLVAMNPIRGRHFLTVGIVLIALRCLQRLWSADTAAEAFRVAPGDHWRTIGIVAVMGVLLLLFRVQVGSAVRSTKA